MLLIVGLSLNVHMLETTEGSMSISAEQCQQHWFSEVCQAWEGFTTLKDTSVHLDVGFGLELGRVTAAISIPKAGSYYCIQDFTRLEDILFTCSVYKNTMTIHMSSSPPVTSMYTCLSKDIMRRQRCEPTTLAKRSALDFVYKTVQVTGLVCESEWLFLVSI